MKTIFLAFAMLMTTGSLSYFTQAEALPKANSTISISENVCLKADTELVKVATWIQSGRTVYDVIYQLDQVTPDPAVMPEAYLGINMVKLNVAAIRTNLQKGFRVEAIRKKFHSNCKREIGNQITLRTKE